MRRFSCRRKKKEKRVRERLFVRFAGENADLLGLPSMPELPNIHVDVYHAVLEGCTTSLQT